MGKLAGANDTMNETTTPPPPASVPVKRVRRSYDAPFKQSAVEHCRRHGGDVSRTAQELGVNPWTLRDWAVNDNYFSFQRQL